MRKISKLNGKWYYCEGHTEDDLRNIETTMVTIPHTFTSEREVEEEIKETTYVYYHTMDSLDKEYYLEFEGVSYACEVYVNQILIGSHIGGFQKFRFLITDALKKGENEIRIYVSMESEFLLNNDKGYAGILRMVSIIQVSKYHFSLMDFGSNGVYIDCKVDKNYANINVRTKVNCPDAFQISCILLDGDKKTVYRNNFAQNDFSFEVDNPTLWQAKENPYLYELKLQLIYNKAIMDEVSVDFGIRAIEMQTDGLYLNQKRMKLRGVAMRPESFHQGGAISDEEIHQDFTLLNELGCNAIRFKDVQVNDLYYKLADQFGFLVCTEVPYLQKYKNDKDGLASLKAQTKELVLQNYNHPSIILWGIQQDDGTVNEGKQEREAIKELHKIIKQLDITRLTIQNNHMLIPPSHPLHQLTDIVGYDLFYGWHGGEINQLQSWFETYQAHCHKPLIISAYGAEGNIKYHSNHPKVGDFTEEYQTRFHEIYYEEIHNHTSILGSFLANLYDQRIKTGIETMGLVTLDKNIKKDVFYFYKACWSNIPFVYLCEKRFKIRSSEYITLVVYSNQEFVTIYVNEEVHTINIKNHIGTIDNIRLHPGENHLKAQAVDCEDTVIFTLSDREEPDYICEDKKQYIEKKEETEMKIKAQEFDFASMDREAEDQRIRRNLFQNKVENYAIDQITQYVKQADEVEIAQMDALFHTSQEIIE